MAYLEITLDISPDQRPDAAGVYQKYREPFLTGIDGAREKQLLLRDDDVQVLHRFDTRAQAESYLQTSLFSGDIVGELGPLLGGDPEIRIYEEA